MGIHFDVFSGTTNKGNQADQNKTVKQHMIQGINQHIVAGKDETRHHMGVSPPSIFSRLPWLVTFPLIHRNSN
jgi:hypothetical protein